MKQTFVEVQIPKLMHYKPSPTDHAMQNTPLPNEPLPVLVAEPPRGRFIYIACPWSPAGGGMYKVADYLIQAQAASTPAHAAQLRPLDTRGPGSAAASMVMLARAVGKLVRGRLDGSLAGVHVNMAERLSLFRKGTIVVACRALRIPVVIHLHAQMQRFYRSLPSPLRSLTRWMFSLASGVVVIGAEPRRFVMTELGVPSERIDIAINGVPGPSTAPPPRVRERKQVLFVGRLCDDKGVSDLLKALARADVDRDRVKLTLAGHGDIEGYRRLARTLGIEELVDFPGWCDQAQVEALLRESDLLVLPSYDEVLPLVLLEALAHGVAVVCTTVGELPILLSDGVDACFVPPGDIDALALALNKVLGDAQLLCALGQRGRALYERRFSLHRFFASVARVHRRHFGIAAELAEMAELPQLHELAGLPQLHELRKLPQEDQFADVPARSELVEPHAPAQAPGLPVREVRR